MESVINTYKEKNNIIDNENNIDFFDKIYLEELSNNKDKIIKNYKNDNKIKDNDNDIILSKKDFKVEMSNNFYYYFLNLKIIDEPDFS